MDLAVLEVPVDPGDQAVLQAQPHPVDPEAPPVRMVLLALVGLVLPVDLKPQAPWDITQQAI